MRSAGFVSLVIVAAVVGILSILGVGSWYFLHQEDKTSTVSDQEQFAQTDNWQLYENKVFGYLIKIPPGFEDAGYGNTSVATFWHKAENKEILAEISIRADLLSDMQREEGIGKIEEYKKMAPGSQKSGSKWLKVKNLDLEECIAFLFRFSKDPGNLEPERPTLDTICIGPKISAAFEMEVRNEEDIEKYKALFEESLATFRFTKGEIDIADTLVHPSKEQYADFFLASLPKWQGNRDFRPATVYVKIGELGESKKAKFIQIWAFGEPLKSLNSEDAIAELKNREEGVGGSDERKFTGILAIFVKFPSTLPSQGVCDLEVKDPQCAVAFAFGEFQLPEPFEMNEGKIEFSFTEDHFIQGKLINVNEYNEMFVSGVFKLKIPQEGKTEKHSF